MGNYEFFKKEFEFHGKHARMAGELWVKGDYEHTYFRRLIDLYMVAAVVGFRVDRKAKEDFSPFGTKIHRQRQCVVLIEGIIGDLNEICISKSHVLCLKGIRKTFIPGKILHLYVSRYEGIFSRFNLNTIQS